MASVYESYTYDQIKALPDDQKITALKELKTTYPDNKDLAKHLDVPFIGVNNMVAKYLEGKTVGRKKMTEEEKAQAKLEREEAKKLKQQIEKQQLQQQEQQKPEVNTTSQTIRNEEPNAILNTTPSVTPIKEESQPIQSKTNSFSIKLDKTMLGEEAISRINGISNSLLKENEYRISLVIEEVEKV